MQNIIYSLSYLFGIFSCILPSPETMLHHFVTTDGLIRVSKKQKIPNSFYFSISVLGMCHLLYDLIATGIILAACMPSVLFDSVYQNTKKNIEALVRSSHRRCSIKKVFLEISQNSQENTCPTASFLINLQAKTCSFIKKETLAQMFRCKFCEISRNTFSGRTPPVAASD